MYMSRNVSAQPLCQDTCVSRPSARSRPFFRLLFLSLLGPWFKPKKDGERAKNARSKPKNVANSKQCT